jgi:hypothetical protein
VGKQTIEISDDMRLSGTRGFEELLSKSVFNLFTFNTHHLKIIASSSTFTKHLDS